MVDGCGIVVALIFFERIQQPSHLGGLARNEIEILDDWYPPRFFLPDKQRVAIKKRIKLPSFHVETFVVFYSSFLSFLLFPFFFHFFSFFSVLPFSKFHPPGPALSILSTGQSIDIEPRLPFFFPLLYPLFFLLFSVLSCFSRFMNVCKVPFTATYPSFLPLRTSNQRLVPAPN